MLIDYLNAALEKAKYEILIGERERFYAEIPICKGVWATGKTLEECRRNLTSTLEGWIIVRLQHKLSIPKIRSFSLKPQRIKN